mgnify:FL=1
MQTLQEQTTPRKRPATEPLLPSKQTTTSIDLLSPLSAKKAKSTRKFLRDDTRPPELRWAGGFSDCAISYPCEMLSSKAKHLLNMYGKEMLRDEDLLDKNLVCFFVGKYVYFSPVTGHDGLPFFVPGDMAYLTIYTRPEQTKTTLRTVKCLLAQLPEDFINKR